MADFLTFTDFNFKLLVIEDLMYTQELLPKFSLHDHAEKNGLDLDKDYFLQVVPAARDYFEQLQIPAELADKVEELSCDGGNEVYHQIVHQWDGEDDTFDVTSAVDAQQFANLTSITLFNPDEVEGVDELRDNGVEVDEL